MSGLDIELVANLSTIAKQVQENEIPDINIGNYTPFSHSSNTGTGFHGQAYYSSSTNTLVIAAAGTNPNHGTWDGLRDLRQDAELGAGLAEYIGLQTLQTSDMQSFVDQTIVDATDQYGGQINIIVTGFSLGGYLAQATAPSNATIVAFESPGMGGLVGSEVTNENVHYYYSNPSTWSVLTTIIHSSGDHVSDNIYYLQGGNDHSISELADYLQTNNPSFSSLAEIQEFNEVQERVRVGLEIFENNPEFLQNPAQVDTFLQGLSDHPEVAMGVYGMAQILYGDIDNLVEGTSYDFRFGRDIGQFNSGEIVAGGIDDAGNGFVIFADQINGVLDSVTAKGLNLTADQVVLAARNGGEDLNGMENAVNLVESSAEPVYGTFDGFEYLDVGPDTPEYDLVILTDFSHGTSSTQVSSEDLIIADVVANGTIVPGGNWSVATTIANESGIFATPSGIAADWNSPGRGTVLDDLSDNVSTIHNDFYGGFVEVSPGVYEHPDVVVAMPSSDITSSFVSINQFAEIDPLVLDLDGDGIELTPFNEHNIYFDVDNDGAIERTGWVGADDGILGHDLNGDGEINNITETLSEYYGAADSRGASGQSTRGEGNYGTGAIYGNGFEALATLDSNNDGIIDASDTQFSTLRVWQDANSDAQTDAGELISLVGYVASNVKHPGEWRMAA